MITGIDRFIAGKRVRNYLTSIEYQNAHIWEEISLNRMSSNCSDKDIF